MVPEVRKERPQALPFEPAAEPTQPAAYEPSAAGAAEKIEVFTHALGDKQIRLRGFMRDGEPWFIARDVTEALGYLDGRKAVSESTEEVWRITVSIRNGNRGNPNLTAINEAGLYALATASKLPEARSFRRWVFETVLPSIRKHGGYILGQEKVDTGEMSDDELMARALQVATRKIAEKDQKIAQQAQHIERLGGTEVAVSLTATSTLPF